MPDSKNSDAARACNTDGDEVDLEFVNGNGNLTTAVHSQLQAIVSRRIAARFAVTIAIAGVIAELSGSAVSDA